MCREHTLIEGFRAITRYVQTLQIWDIAVNPFSTNFFFCKLCNIFQLIVPNKQCNQVANTFYISHIAENEHKSSAPCEGALVVQANIYYTVRSQC